MKWWTNARLLLMLILSSCINNAPNGFVQTRQPESSNCFVKQELVSSDKETNFKYKDISFSLKYDVSEKGYYLLNADSLQYPLDIDLESPQIDIWYYKCSEKTVVLIEGDDYYSSIFYVYYLINQNLYYLGHLYVSQPNVEDEGIFEKDFKISNADDQFEIISLLNGNVYDTIVFKEMHPIQRN